ncbi:host attachment family protein [Altererythrobacter fulvus]|uniref:host attachment family protein n=1 Tax=Caenibius fulvus TaxID=2126012 RepID=UPI00301AB86A
MLLPHGAIIALADGTKFELYRNSGNEAEPELTALPSPKLDEHNHGSGGRHYSSAGNPQASLQDEDAHAAGVAEWLNGQVLGHKIDKLVVIAAPRTLGELRKHYHKQTEHALLGEFHKDLVGHKPEDILEALKAK